MIHPGVKKTATEQQEIDNKFEMKPFFAEGPTGKPPGARNPVWYNQTGYLQVPFEVRSAGTVATVHFTTSTYTDFLFV